MSRPKPILVVGAPGASIGTIAAALGRNPEAFDLPFLNIETEDTLYDAVFEMTGFRAAQLHGLLRALGLLLGGEQSMLSVEMARRWLMERLFWPTSMAADFFRDRLAPRRAVIPLGAGLFDTQSRARIAAFYPDAEIVTVRKHPASYRELIMSRGDGAVATLLGASGGVIEGQKKSPDPVKLWSMAEKATAALAELLPDAPRHAVRIEDVAAAPETEMGRLARALGLTTDAAACAAMARPEASPFAGPGPYGAHAPSDIQPFAEIVETQPAPPVALPKAARAVGYS